MKLTYERQACGLLILFLLFWTALAINPADRHDWMLENVMLVPVSALILWGWRHRLFSRVSHGMIFVFLCLHEVGAHYTYSLVPYNEWTEALFGRPLNDWFGWSRNHYDRLLHFLYGLLCAYPFREIFLRVAKVKGFWSYFLPLDLMTSTSAFFELIEWAVAEIFGGDLGAAYVGTQGDVWDAHKDIALASLGALLAMIANAWVNHSCQRDFAREWSDSLEVG
jgi:putative membrane protein